MADDQKKSSDGPKRRPIQYSAPVSHSNPSMSPPPPSSEPRGKPSVVEEAVQAIRSSIQSMQESGTLDRMRRNFTKEPASSSSMEQNERLSGKAAPNPGDFDKNFAVAVAIYTGAIVTGLFLLADNPAFSSNWWSGFVYVIVGGLAVATITPLFRSKLDVMRSSRSLWAAAIATWLLLGLNFGFAIYDHFWPKIMVTAATPDKWPALTTIEASSLAARVRFIPPEDIVVACETIKCRDLADGIADILQKTPDWKVSILHRGGMDITGVTGIQINPDEPATQALRDAIESTTSLQVRTGPDNRKDVGNNQTFLVVGTRPF